MTNDAPRHTPPRETTQPAPNFDVNMSTRQDGNFRQNGNLEQRGNQALDQRGNQALDQSGNQVRQDGNQVRQDGRVQQDVSGRVQQDVQGNRLNTGDVRSDNRSGSSSGASVDDHSVNNRTDKSVVMGSQFLPECTFGLSIGAAGTGAFQIGVPSESCMKARGQAIEVQANAQVDIARTNADARVQIERARAQADENSARANAQASVLNTAIEADSRDLSEGRNHAQAMTKIACDFSIDRAGTARQSWQQFDTMGAKIGRHPTAKAGTQQLWKEAVTSSAQSMDAGAVCIQSARNELGITAKPFEVPDLEFEKPKPPAKPKAPEKPKDKTEPCPDKDKEKGKGQ